MTQTATRGGGGGGAGTANAALVVSWGQPTQPKAPQVLQEALQYYKRLQEQGQIESYDPIILEPHGREQTSMIVLRGSREGLNRIRMSDEFIRLCSRAQLVTSNVEVTGGFAGSDFDRLVSDWTQSVQDLGIR